MPAIGFAVGLERILLSMPETGERPEPSVAVLPLAAGAAGPALLLARNLRALDVTAEVDWGGAGS